MIATEITAELELPVPVSHSTLSMRAPPAVALVTIGTISRSYATTLRWHAVAISRAKAVNDGPEQLGLDRGSGIVRLIGFDGEMFTVRNGLYHDVTI